jgi:hypothetical protein
MQKMWLEKFHEGAVIKIFISLSILMFLHTTLLQYSPICSFWLQSGADFLKVVAEW